MTALHAAWSKRGAGRVTHLFMDDADRSLCGTLRGSRASVVTCRSCLYKYAEAPEGRKIARAAAEQAIAYNVNSATSLSAEPDLLERLAAAFAPQAMNDSSDGDGHEG